jgi:molybdate transport system regulatory protein
VRCGQQCPADVAAFTLTKQRKGARTLMQLSARNQLKGTIKEITGDEIMTEVLVTLEGGQEITSVITSSSVQRLGLSAGTPITVVVKSTEVMLASDD